MALGYMRSYTFFTLFTFASISHVNSFAMHNDIFCFPTASELGIKYITSMDVFSRAT